MFGKESVLLQVSQSLAANTNHIKTDDELVEELKNELIDQKNDICAKSQHVATSLCQEYYYVLGDYAEQLTRGKYEQLFSIFMIMAIALAAVNAGLELEPDYPQGEAAIIDYVVLAAFAFEFILKIVAEKSKPQCYFFGKDGVWNTFDFLVLIFCLLGSFQTQLSLGKSSIARLVTKLFRFARVVKLLKRIPNLQVIVNGLLGGFESIGYIMLLMMIFWYIFAVIGVMYFGEHDPFYFRNLGVAMITLFRALTYDNWGTNVFITYYGCANFNGGVYAQLQNITDDFLQSVPNFYVCDNPVAMPQLAIIYWCSFVVITGLILLSLFIGTITMSMQTALRDVRTEIEESRRKKRLAKQVKEYQALKLFEFAAALKAVECEDDEVTLESISRLISHWLRSSTDDLLSKLSIRKQKGSKVLSLNEEQKLARIEDMRKEMRKAWDGTSQDQDTAIKLSQEHLPWHVRLRRNAAMYCRFLIDTDSFQYTSITILLFTTILVGYEINCAVTATIETNRILSDLEWLVVACFSVEIIIRFTAEEYSLYDYLRSPWNVFDVLVTTMSASRLLSGTTMLRIIRIFRIVKLTKAVPQLGIIVNAIFIALSSITYIIAIMLIFFYILGIFGVMMFGKNDPVHFHSLEVAMIYLFDWSTLDNWGTVMLTNYYGCDKFPLGGSPDCTDPHAWGALALVFFFIMVIVGNFVLLTLFIGVITTGMEAATNYYKMELEMERRLKEVTATNGVSVRVLDHYRRVFSILDLDGSGTIEPTELHIGLSSIGINLSPEELVSWINENDCNFNGVFDMPEFIIFMITLNKKNLKRKLKKGVNMLKHRSQALIKAAKFLGKRLGTTRISPSPIAEDLNEDEQQELEGEQAEENSTGQAARNKTVVRMLFKHVVKRAAPKAEGGQAKLVSMPSMVFVAMGNAALTDADALIDPIDEPESHPTANAQAGVGAQPMLSHQISGEVESSGAAAVSVACAASPDSAWGAGNKTLISPAVERTTDSALLSQTKDTCEIIDVQSDASVKSSRCGEQQNAAPNSRQHAESAQAAPLQHVGMPPTVHGYQQTKTVSFPRLDEGNIPSPLTHNSFIDAYMRSEEETRTRPQMKSLKHRNVSTSTAPATNAHHLGSESSPSRGAYLSVIYSEDELVSHTLPAGPVQNAWINSTDSKDDFVDDFIRNLAQSSAVESKAAKSRRIGFNMAQYAQHDASSTGSSAMRPVRKTSLPAFLPSQEIYQDRNQLRANEDLRRGHFASSRDNNKTFPEPKARSQEASSKPWLQPFQPSKALSPDEKVGRLAFYKNMMAPKSGRADSQVGHQEQLQLRDGRGAGAGAVVGGGGGEGDINCADDTAVAVTAAANSSSWSALKDTKAVAKIDAVNLFLSGSTAAASGERDMSLSVASTQVDAERRPQKQQGAPSAVLSKYMNRRALTVESRAQPNSTASKYGHTTAANILSPQKQSVPAATSVNRARDDAVNSWLDNA